MAKKSPAQIHSFSTNFFGVMGYIGSTSVWLLVCVCIVALLPIDVTSVFVSGTTIAGVEAAEQSSPSTTLTLLLLVLIALLFWAFSYYAAKVLTRVLRRVAKLFTRDAGVDGFFRTKYFVHALGLLLLVILTIISPLYSEAQAVIAFLGLVAGLMGICGIVLQRRLMIRHKVPFDSIL